LLSVDGKTYSLRSFAKPKALVIIFISNPCHTAQAYEDRIKMLTADDQSKEWLS